MNLWIAPPGRETVRRDMRKTRIHDDGGKSATWNETFTLDVVSFQVDHLFCEVMNDNSVTGDTLIGHCSIPCASIQPLTTEMWVKIFRENGKEAGEICLSSFRQVSNSGGPAGQSMYQGQPGQPMQQGPPGQPMYQGQPGPPGQQGPPGQPMQQGPPGQPIYQGQQGQPMYQGQPGEPMQPIYQGQQGPLLG